jgi:DNA-binding NtrC family response regulator
VIAFVSKNEADYRTLRETAGRLSQSVVACADVREALRAIRWHAPEIVVCEARCNGNWQELLEGARAAQSLLLIVSRHADERLWADVLTLGGFDVLALPFDRNELRRVLSSALRHSRRDSVAAAAGSLATAGSSL